MIFSKKKDKPSTLTPENQKLKQCHDELNAIKQNGRQNERLTLFILRANSIKSS
jgi:hypothetical protein